MASCPAMHCGTKHEATLKEKEFANDKGEGIHHIQVMFELLGA